MWRVVVLYLFIMQILEMAWPVAVDVNHDWSTAPPVWVTHPIDVFKGAPLWFGCWMCIKDLVSLWVHLLSQIRICLHLLILFGKFDR